MSKFKLCHLPSDVTELGDEFIGDVSGGGGSTENVVQEVKDSRFIVY